MSGRRYSGMQAKKTMANKRTGKAGVRSAKTLNYSTPALEKGLDLIELLAHQPAGLTKSQMARPEPYDLRNLPNARLP
jgi:hypothetical protein